MPQIGNKKYPYTKEGLARYKHDLRKLSMKKKKIQKQYGMSANMDHLISLEAKMDDSFEFYADPQKKKEGSALGTAAKVAGVGALGAGAYGLASAARGDSLKGGGLMSGVKDTKGIGNKLGQVKKNFGNTGGMKGLAGRAMGVMKRDKKKLLGGVKRLFRR